MSLSVDSIQLFGASVNSQKIDSLKTAIKNLDVQKSEGDQIYNLYHDLGHAFWRDYTIRTS